MISGAHRCRNPEMSRHPGKHLSSEERLPRVKRPLGECAVAVIVKQELLDDIIATKMSVRPSPS